MSGGMSKIWAAFRRWPLKTQIITGVVAGLLTIGAIGSAVGGGKNEASSVSLRGSSETTSTTSRPERTTSTSTSTTVASTTTTEAPTTTVPPTTAPPTTKAAPVPPTTEAAPAADCQGYDPCLPPGDDVDCAGGSGNGPRYVDGPVYVTGSDPYDLDRNGDGVGCE
jgi:hypothetical protein